MKCFNNSDTSCNNLVNLTGNRGQNQVTDLTRVVVATGDNSFFDPVTPGSSWESSVAAESATVTAGNQIFGRQVGIHFTLRVNANTVRHGLDSSKSLQ